VHSLVEVVKEEGSTDKAVSKGEGNYYYYYYYC